MVDVVDDDDMLATVEAEPRLSGWNHRAMYILGEHGERYYHLHEVWYDMEGNPSCWTGPIDPFGEDVEELEWVLNHMLVALKKPSLHYYVNQEGDADFGGPEWGKDPLPASASMREHFPHLAQ